MDVFATSPIIQEILNLNKELSREIKSLHAIVEGQRKEITALNGAIEGITLLAPQEQKESTLLTPAEAAKELRCHRKTLYRWETSRELIPVRIGGKIYYRSEQVDKIKIGTQKNPQ